MDNKRLEEKMEQFVPGMPEDPALLPDLFFQVLLGKAYSLKRWPNESTSRGVLELAELEERFGAPITREGWYSATGEYLGAQLPGSLLE